MYIYISQHILVWLQRALFPEWLWFAGFSGSEERAGLGDVCERLCASRSLLGSYVHQESI